MEHNRINVAAFIGGTKNVYSDYEELAFMNPKRVWLERLFNAIQDIGRTFARDKDEPKDFMDLVFYASVHCLHAYVEQRGRASKQAIDDVVEAVAFTLDLIQTNDHIVRSSIDWDSPDAYAEWWQSA